MKTKELHCWRVWFVDDSAVEVDAYTEQEAKSNAIRLAEQQQGETRVSDVEDLGA